MKQTTRAYLQLASGLITILLLANIVIGMEGRGRYFFGALLAFTVVVVPLNFWAEWKKVRASKSGDSSTGGDL